MDSTSDTLFIAQVNAAITTESRNILMRETSLVNVTLSFAIMRALLPEDVNRMYES